MSIRVYKPVKNEAPCPGNVAAKAVDLTSILVNEVKKEVVKARQTNTWQVSPETRALFEGGGGEAAAAAAVPKAAPKPKASKKAPAENEAAAAAQASETTPAAQASEKKVKKNKANPGTKAVPAEAAAAAGGGGASAKADAKAVDVKQARKAVEQEKRALESKAKAAAKPQSISKFQQLQKMDVGTLINVQVGKDGQSFACKISSKRKDDELGDVVMLTKLTDTTSSVTVHSAFPLSGPDRKVTLTRA